MWKGKLSKNSYQADFCLLAVSLPFLSLVQTHSDTWCACIHTHIHTHTGYPINKEQAVDDRCPLTQCRCFLNWNKRPGREQKDYLLPSPPLNSLHRPSTLSIFKKTFKEIQSHVSRVNYYPDTDSLMITHQSLHGPHTSQVIPLLMFS